MVLLHGGLDRLMLLIHIIDEVLSAHDLESRYTISDWEKIEGTDYSTEFEGEEKHFFSFNVFFYNHLCYVIPIGTFTIHNSKENKTVRALFNGKTISFLGKESVEYEQMEIPIEQEQSN